MEPRPPSASPHDQPSFEGDAFGAPSPSRTNTEIGRRSLVTGAAWSVPAIALAVAAPLASASEPAPCEEHAVSTQIQDPYPDNEPGGEHVRDNLVVYPRTGDADGDDTITVIASYTNSGNDPIPAGAFLTVGWGNGGDSEPSWWQVVGATYTTTYGGVIDTSVREQTRSDYYVVTGSEMPPGGVATVTWEITKTDYGYTTRSAFFSQLVSHFYANTCDSAHAIAFSTYLYSQDPTPVDLAVSVASTAAPDAGLTTTGTYSRYNDELEITYGDRSIAIVALSYDVTISNEGDATAPAGTVQLRTPYQSTPDSLSTKTTNGYSGGFSTTNSNNSVQTLTLDADLPPGASITVHVGNFVTAANFGATAPVLNTAQFSVGLVTGSDTGVYEQNTGNNSTQMVFYAVNE